MKGSVPEWLMGADCKSVGYAYAGSNPARPIEIKKLTLKEYQGFQVYYFFVSELFVAVTYSIKLVIFWVKSFQRRAIVP